MRLEVPILAKGRQKLGIGLGNETCVAYAVEIGRYLLSQLRLGFRDEFFILEARPQIVSSARHCCLVHDPGHARSDPLIKTPLLFDDDHAALFSSESPRVVP
ncbi:protein of unknown function [Agreia sp. COWG]|nr:protein of unknown function [Agreia sp. COWG]